MYSLLKWGILFKVLPLTISFAIVKIVIHWLDWEIWEFDSLNSALLSAATFIVALTLSGTLSDYRSSEGIPLQIVNSIETIQDTNLLLGKAFSNYDHQTLQHCLWQISKSIIDWLQQNQDFNLIIQELDHLNTILATVLTINGTAPFINRIQGEQAKIRLLIQQIKGNRDSEFLAPAYVLLWLFLIASTVALLLIEADFSENIVISSFLFTSFYYLLFLIRDLDNPFQYDGKSSVDVDLSLLINLQNQLQEKK